MEEGKRPESRNATADLVGRLLSGESVGSIGREPEFSPERLAVALGDVALAGDGLGRPALVREKPLYQQLREHLSEPGLAPLFPDATRPSLLALSAGLLLIHDFWDASHEAAQLADDLGERYSSAYWHGIAHRREPDPGNASYWFRRVGKHAIFPDLAAYARARITESPGAGPAGRLLEGGVWNPFAMIELCGAAKSGSPSELLALDLQREEMRLLLLATVDRIVG